MRKTLCKLSFVVTLGMLPTLAFATYLDCRSAGGSMMGCFYEAAMNDRIAIPIGGDQCDAAKLECTQTKRKLLEEQIQVSFKKNKDRCSKAAETEQMACLSKGMPALQKKVANKQTINKVNSLSQSAPVLKAKVASKQMVNKIAN